MARDRSSGSTNARTDVHQAHGATRWSHAVQSATSSILSRGNSLGSDDRQCVPLVGRNQLPILWRAVSGNSGSQLNCHLVYLQLAGLVGRRLDRGPDKRGIGRTANQLDCADAEGFWRLLSLLD